MKLTFYVKPTEEHCNQQGEYALIREGTLYLFTGKDYDSTPENEKCHRDLSKLTQQEKDTGSIKCEIDTQSIIANLNVELHNTNNYKTIPINKKTLLHPIIYTNITYPAPFRFQTREQSSVLIGLIKAYKIPHFHYNHYGKVDINNDNTESTYSWKNEIYTIDIKQTIRLKAFVYKKQKTYVAQNQNNIYANNEEPTNVPAQQGNITKIIKKISSDEAQNIKWAFKIVDGSYLADDKKYTRNKAFPPLTNKISTINLADKNHKRLDSIPNNKDYVEIEGKYGTTLALKLCDLFDKKLLKSLINKNIIFFAFDKNEGIAMSKGNGIKYETIQEKKRKVGIYNAYARYAMRNYDNWSKRQITQDRVASIELKIVKSRFGLEFDGQTLKFLENKRVMGEWLCKTNATTKIKEKERNIDFHLLFQSLQEEYIDLGNDEIKLIKLLKDCYITRNQQPIKLYIKPQKRVLILIERFKEGTESTMGRMNVFIDDKRVDSNGKFIAKNTAQGNKEYEMFNPFSLPNDENNYAYILERPGPDSIAGEVNLRIPEGRYNVMWNDGNMKGVLKLFNNYLSKGREILIHGGNTPKDSEGCLLINDKKVSDNTIIKIENEKKVIRFKQNLEHWLKKINNNTIDGSVTIIIKNNFVINNINEIVQSEA